MQTACLCLLFCCSAWAQTSLALLTEFQTSASDTAILAMKAEIQKVMQPLGVQVEWHSVAEAQSLRKLPRFVMLSFEGICRAQPAEWIEEEKPILAYTQVNGERVLPFSKVECNQVRSLLHATSYSREPDVIFGRALGRVVAHEMYHVLLGTRQHASHGIAKAIQNSWELTKKDLFFDAPSLRSLRLKLGQTETPAPTIATLHASALKH